MVEVGVRELKLRASSILRRVRESKESFTITYRGRPIARLVPIEDEKSIRAETKAVLAAIDDLAVEIDALWPHGATAAEAVKEQRREI